MPVYCRDQGKYIRNSSHDCILQGPKKIYQELLLCLYSTTGTKENIPGTPLMAVIQCILQGPRKYIRNSSHVCIVLQEPKKIYQELLSCLYSTAGTKENITRTPPMYVQYCRNQGKYIRNSSHVCVILQGPRKIYQELLSCLYSTAGTKENVPGTPLMSVKYYRDQGKYTRNSSHVCLVLQ